MRPDLKQIEESVERNREKALSLFQRLVRTPSPSGQEAQAAGVLAEEMRSSGFDVVIVDRLNNVMSTIRGAGGRSLLLNGHLDHVPVGSMVDPYSGKLSNGDAFGVKGQVVYGRGASDMKGAVAAMAMAGAIIKDLGVDLRGDFKVAAVSQEEVGGQGTLATIQESRFLGDLIVVGEATDMGVALGHRGGAGTSVVIRGRSCHASTPELGVNALYKAVDLIERIRSDLVPRLPDHPIFGRATLVATRMDVKPNIGNVVPDECEFYLDCRNNPNFPAEALKKELEEIISRARSDDPDLDARVVSPSIIRGLKGFTGFYTDPSAHPVVNEAIGSIGEALGVNPRTFIWRFATDGQFYSRMGLPVIGFGPGEERFAHTHQDHIRVEDYLDAIKAYAWLACRICGVES